MKAEINRIKWKSRRGMRELDLLFENFFEFYADKISKSELQTLKDLLVYDDQTLFDFIFKDIKLGNSEHEDFIKNYSIPTADVNKSLAFYMDESDGDIEATAKNFLSSNSMWESWVPSDVASKVKASL